MEYTTIASSGTNGPIVGGLNAGTVFDLIGYFTIFDWADFSNLLQSLVNQDISQAEVGQPEGQRIALDITGLDGKAAFVAGQIQNYYAQGRIVGPSGSAITAWPEYPGTIAWGDSSTDTLTLRWVKKDPFVWIIVGILLVALGVLAYYYLTGSSWNMSAATPGGGGSGGSPSPLSVVSWFVKNLWWEIPVAGILAAAPWLIRQSRRTYEQTEDFERDIEGRRR